MKLAFSGLPSEDVKKLEIQTRQFDPIRQHRHFCPWVNGHVAAATSSTGPDISCGWQTMLDALQDQRSGTGFAASEFAASNRKVSRFCSNNVSFNTMEYTIVMLDFIGCFVRLL